MIKTKTISTEKETQECCAPFDVAKWHNIRHEWHNKLFLKDSLPEILHIPLPGTYRKTISRMWKIASDAGAAPDPKDFLLLAHDPSAFKAELYMSVTKDIKDHDVVKFNGSFLSLVYEGSYRDVHKFLRKTDKFLSANGLAPKKYYIYFPYCPKCAEKYGHNYMVVVTETLRIN